MLSHPKKSVFAALSPLFVALAGDVNAVTLSFGNTELFPATSSDFALGAPALYTEAGYLITANTGLNAIFDPVDSPFSSHYFTFQGSSTTAEISLLGGGPFNLLSLDIALGEFSVGSSTDITFDGILVDGGTLSETFTNVSLVQNVTLNWSRLSSFTVSGSDDPGLDNIVLVPEPSSLLFLGAAAFGLVGRRRRDL